VFSIPESSATSTSTYSTNAGACPECKTVIDGPLNGTYGLKRENNFLCPDGCVYENDVTAQLFCFEQNGLYYVHSCPKENTTTTTTTTTVSAKSCADPKLLESSMITCTASSEFNSDWGCQKAFDGEAPCNQNWPYSGTSWATKGEGVGAWIKAEFVEVITIKKLRIKQRFSMVEQSSGIEIAFDGGVKKDFKLGVKGCYSWNIINLSEPVATRTMKIRISSVYAKVNNGFKEIEIYGCI